MGNKYLVGRDLETFLSKNGFPTYEEEMLAMLRRLDFDNDSVINF
jgi:hypothetical protein